MPIATPLQPDADARRFDIPRSLPPELASHVFERLSPEDCIRYAKSDKYHWNEDAQLWRRIAAPTNRVPLNAPEAWAARRDAEVHRVEESLLWNSSIDDRIDNCAKSIACGFLAGHMAGAGALLWNAIHDRDCSAGTFLAPYLSTLAIGVVVGVAFLLPDLWRMRLRPRPAERVEQPELKWPKPETLPKTPAAIRMRLQSLAPLQQQLDVEMYSLNLLASHDMRFLVDILRLPIPLRPALAGGHTALAVRSLKRGAFVTSDTLQAAIHSASRNQVGIKALELTVRSIGRDEYFNESLVNRRWHWDELICSSNDDARVATATATVLIEPLDPATVSRLINTVDRQNQTDSLFHLAAQHGSWPLFSLFLKHGGDLEIQDPFGGATVRQIALRNWSLRSHLAAAEQTVQSSDDVEN